MIAKVDLHLRYSPTTEKTTILIMSGEEPEVLKNYRCHVCGRIIFSYYGNVKMALPGEPPQSLRPKMVECQSRIEQVVNGVRSWGKCKAKYWVT